MEKIEIEGNTIDYKEVGTGYPLLFIHGAFSSGKTWRKVVPELSAHFRCIIPEWPFGGHKTPIQHEMDFTPSGIAELISKVLDSLNLTQVMIVANDTGGAYAQVFTAKYSQKVSSLVLTNCEGFEIFPPKKFQSLKTMVKVPGYLRGMARLFRFTSFLKLNITFGLLSNSLKKEEIYEFYVKEFSENKLIQNDFRQLAAGWDPKYTIEAAKKLSSFEQPVLILWGTEDKLLFPVELGKRLKALFQNGTFVEIPDSMTYVQEDNPKELARNIIRFSKEQGLL